MNVLKRIMQSFIFILPPSFFRILQNKLIYEPRIKQLKVGKNNMPLFDTVFFEVRTKCNGICSFCSASGKNDIREDTSMPAELYKKVIDELATLNFSGRIAYHVNNDPIIFPPLVEFINYARPKLPKVWIQILTNGRALTASKAEELLRAGINELSINWYNDDFSVPLPKPLQEIKDNLIFKFYKPEQIRNCGRPKNNDKNIFVFNIERRKSTGFLTSRAGTSPNKKEKSKMLRGFCEYPFTQFNITADGRVNKCCADFYFTDVMGNVNNESLMNVWKGEKFQKVRNLLLEGNREAMETCKKCDYYGSRKVYSFLGKFFYWLTR